MKAQTPVCREEDKIVMKDTAGNETGQFAAFSTLHEIEMKKEDTNREPKEYRLQAGGLSDDSRASWSRRLCAGRDSAQRLCQDSSHCR